MTGAVIGTCVWVGVDSAWEQEKLEARKMLENAAESHTSGAPPHDESHHVSPKKQGRNGSILQSGRRKSRTKQWRPVLITVPRCTLVSDQNDVSTGGAKQPTTKRTDPD